MKINKKIKILDFKLSKIINWWLFGAYKSRFSWNGMEFSEHREYNFWDQLKDIDWKASSKWDLMYIKKYEEERDLNVLFILDNSLSMKFGSKDKTKKDILEEIFYGLALSAYYKNDNIWWLIFDEVNLDFIDYKKSRNNIYKILNTLDQKKENKKNKDMNKFNTIFKYLINRWIKDNLIFIITDEIKNINEKLLKSVSNINDIIYINVFDVIENNLIDLDGDISLSFWNEFSNITLNDYQRKNYIQYRKEKINYLKEVFNKSKIWYISLDSKSDVFSKLIRYFNKIKK